VLCPFSNPDSGEPIRANEKVEPLSYFIEECEEAKSMLPDKAEYQFTKIIKTRIVGEARRTIQDQIFDSVVQLKYLEQIYSPFKNFYQLQGELGSIYQKNEENVVTYANRVKLLGKQILEAENIEIQELPFQVRILKHR